MGLLSQPYPYNSWPGNPTMSWSAYTNSQTWYLFCYKASYFPSKRFCFMIPLILSFEWASWKLSHAGTTQLVVDLYLRFITGNNNVVTTDRYSIFCSCIISWIRYILNTRFQCQCNSFFCGSLKRFFILVTNISTTYLIVVLKLTLSQPNFPHNGQITYFLLSL